MDARHYADEGKALEAAMEYARKLAKGPSVAVDLARRFGHKALVSTLDEMFDYEAVVATMSAHTEDAREGTKAFVEKRTPEFRGGSAVGAGGDRAPQV